MTTSVPTTRPPAGKGWRVWYIGALNGTTPYQYVEVEIWRRGWQQTGLIDPVNLDPWFNVANLYWRPAGPMRDMAAYYRKALGMRGK